VVNEKVDSFDEYRVLLPDGTVKHVISSGHPVLDGNGEFIAFIGTATDVTERKRAEEALRESEAKIRRLVDSNIIGIFVWDFDGRILEANDEFLRMVSYDRADLASGRIRWAELTPPDWRDRNNARIEQQKSSGRFEPFEKEFTRKEGSRVPILIGGATFEEGGNQGVAFVLDLTERKRAEQALREREAKIRRLVDSNIIGIFIWDFDGRVLEANDEFLRTVSYDREDLVSGRIRWTELTPPDWRERDNAKIEQQKISGRLEPFEKQYIRKDGRRVPVLIGVATFEEGGNEGVAFVLDLTERKRAEEALRESERSARSALDGIAGLVAIMTPNGEVETVNRQCVEYFGRSVEEQKDWVTTDMVHPEDLPHMLENFKRAIASEIPYHFEQRLRRFDGEYRWFETRGGAVRDDTGSVVRWYVLLTDIEDRVRALARLEQMQADFAHINRVATIGQLTASITHEVNQPITAAVTYALAARRFLSADPPNLLEVDDALSLIVKEGNRAGEVVGRIRALIRKAPARKDAVAINDAILEIIALSRTEAANNSVSVRTQLAEGLSHVLGDRVQLQQVLLNLIINAIEAMRDVAEGERELLISSRNVPDGVSVEVRDSGPGFAPGDIDRVFEAFYSTKSSGVGLGLSICRSIIEAHNGRLWASPNVPRGAVFRFTAPAHPTAAS